MATLATVAFISLLAVKHFSVDVFLSGALRSVGCRSAQPVAALDVPNELLLHFYDVQLPASVPNREDPVFVSAVNQLIVGNGSHLALNPASATVRQRLSNAVSRVGSKIHRLTGSKKNKLKRGKTVLHVFEGETKNINLLEERVQQLEEEVDLSRVRVDEWEEKYKNLQDAQAQLYAEMKSEIFHEREQLRMERENLSELTGKAKDFVQLRNRGCTLQDVGKRQQFRKLGELKTNCEKALWFANTFGLMPSSLTFVTQAREDREKMNVEVQFEDGKASKIRMERDTRVDPTNGGDNTAPAAAMCADGPRTNRDRFNALPQDEKDKIKQILFLMDHYNGSDNLYHEVSMLFEDMPRAYLVWAYRKKLNESFNVQPLEGDFPGARMEVRGMLQAEICRWMAENEIEDPTGQEFNVKFSGDGAKFSRTSNFTLMSFAILERGKEVLSTRGMCTFAALKAPEAYDSLKTSLSPVWEEINTIIKEGGVEIDGKHVKLNFYLSGDYKFLLMVMGFNSAKSDFACLWCDVHKNDRWDTSFGEEYYDKKRTLKKMEEMAKKKTTKERKGCVNTPLINIEPENVVADELHLLLRIMDRLLKNIIQAADSWDKKEWWEAGKKGRPTGLGKHLKGLESGIRECKLSFTIWRKKNEEGAETDALEWTSLLGRDKKILLERLPEKFPEVLPPSDVEQVTKLWEDFRKLYGVITQWEPLPDEASKVFSMAKNWLELFLSLGNTLLGYQRKHVTPYMHIMVYHVPRMIHQFGHIKKFSGQGVEKNNDVAKGYYFSSNKHNAAESILETSMRVHTLRHETTSTGEPVERIKRAYKRKIHQPQPEEPPTHQA